MTLVVHDFSGHPFQAELSRRLAGLGHDVEHLSAAEYVSGKGHLDLQPGDPATLQFATVALSAPFQKYSPLARLRWEAAYGRAWIKKLRAQRPEAVIACNLPLVSMYRFARYAKRSKLPYVMWHQDIYSSGINDELRRRLPGPVARLGAKVFIRMEAYCARNAAHVVAIGDAFKEVYPSWKVAPQNVSVIPNWAPLDKVFPVERANPRSTDLFTDDESLRMVYAGTIGRKHNPRLLVDLLRSAREMDIPAALVVISEGESADELAQIAGREPDLHLTVLPFQPAADLPNVLGSADLLIALLEPDATKFSIPSKVLSYMAAGRPIVGLMPEDNPAAADIRTTGGLVVDPDAKGVAAAATWIHTLASDDDRIREIGVDTRRVAEEKFDADKVAAQFEAILASMT